jgi:hypothetical protein
MVRLITRCVVAAFLAASAVPGLPAPTASADPCPDVEVIFARGTTEAPGVGGIGQAFVDDVRSKVSPKTVGVYAVQYPASTDFPTGVIGISDASAYIQSTAASCPGTRMVLGGYSQGAAVMGFVTADSIPAGAPAGAPAPMPPEVADHVAAVALFGKPSPKFMSAVEEPAVSIGPLYAAKTTDLCVPGDPVCADGGSVVNHGRYVPTGLVDQAAAFAAARV